MTQRGFPLTFKIYWWQKKNFCFWKLVVVILLKWTIVKPRFLIRLYFWLRLQIQAKVTGTTLLSLLKLAKIAGAGKSHHITPAGVMRDEVTQYIYITFFFLGAYGVMAIVVGNGHGDLFSNPERGCLHYTKC